jgi:small glutamine-rich tetratricopeptide repeat-containing protein alpha
MDLGGMADILRGVTGGGPGGGGAPDLSGLLNNPMMAQMAQSMMANGGLERLMQNPSVANMVGHSSPG